MIESQTLIGFIIGGIFRLIPEFLKYIDRFFDRIHERKMQEIAYKFQNIQNKQNLDKLEIINNDSNDTLLNILKSFKDKDNKEVSKWYLYSSILSSLMRPLITIQWVLFLYPSVIILTFILSLNNNSPVGSLNLAFGIQEKQLVSSIMSFWFLDRVLKVK